ncbi:MAG: ADP-glyceromanno-heptose 6-epimerase [Bacteroidota bacterium]
MIIVTGAAGFIGSCMVSKLNNKGYKDMVLVDDFSKVLKMPNTLHKRYHEKVERTLFFEWLSKYSGEVEFIIHLGARTDTTEFNMAIFDELNLNFSKKIWEVCTQRQIPLIYASSAATYGDGSLGYDDHEPDLSFRLKPLNPYGISKNEFDKWVLEQQDGPPRWYGLKFFNVFGPNEYHKGRMASVVFHAYRQITEPASVKLFRSHNIDFKDGEQLRDFIYVKDVTDVMYFLMNHTSDTSLSQGPSTLQPASAPYRLRPGTGDSGIYNLGAGKARTFLALVNAVFKAVDKSPHIEFIDTPADIRDKYQYFTEANMQKLRSIGYSKPFYTLEDGIEEYVQGYLIGNNCY